MSDAKPESAAPKKSKKLLLVALLGVVLTAGGAGGAWYFLGKKAVGDEEEAHVEKKHDAKPLFTTLDPFTVNLQDPRGERFAQIGVTLQFEDPALEMKIKDRLPAVRNEILLLISSKQIDDLLSTEGKQRLAQEIRVRAARSLGIEVADVTPAPAADDKPVQQAKAAKDDKVAKEEGGDDEAEAEVKPKAKAKSKSKKKHLPENPIQQVLFSQFIVQ